MQAVFKQWYEIGPMVKARGPLTPRSVLDVFTQHEWSYQTFLLNTTEQAV